MKLLRLEIGEKFRSLHAGFSIDFHTLSENDLLGLLKFQPFCFAGLNGNGKSNVLEALASIFYHLELCVAKFKPDAIKKHFNPEKSIPDVYKLTYLIGQKNGSSYTFSDFDLITVEKEKGKAPEMYKQSFEKPFTFNKERVEISLVPNDSKISVMETPGKLYLPDILVGYSSGENEILSLPFRKSRLINFDKYVEDFHKGYKFVEPENSLIYIDAEMSQAVLLSCLLFENDDTLKPLNDEIGIEGISSFRMNLNNEYLTYPFDESSGTSFLAFKHIRDTIQSLKNISSCWFETYYDIHEHYKEKPGSHLTLDFYIDSNTKKAFRSLFNTSFDLFRFLQVLYELNLYSIETYEKDIIYDSKGVYTDWKIPESKPKSEIFTFLNFFVKKRIEKDKEPIELLLREFSDGEHQFIHTMGICLMLKDRRSLLLLDEPETHFNPAWRAKFIKVLSASIEAGGGNNMMKDIILSSHSPFIISDCFPDKVIVFEKDNTGKVTALSANSLNMPTFGTSIDEISSNIFKYEQSIGELSNTVFEQIDYDALKSEEDVLNAKKEIKFLGDSIEKDLTLARLNQILTKIKKQVDA